MDSRTLILLALCAVSVKPLKKDLTPVTSEQDLKSRSDAFSPYANELTQDYEPVAYAAIPLHQPMPVIAILSENPLLQNVPKIYGQKGYASNKQSKYAKPDYQQNYFPSEYNPYKEDYNFQKPYTEYPRSPLEYTKPHVEYPKTYSPVEYSKPYALDYKPYPQEYMKNFAPVDYRPYPEEYVKPYASVEAPTILYARPSENGGYTYHRRPLKSHRPKKPRKAKPMVIRVHKYRVIRDRNSGHYVDE